MPKTTAYERRCRRWDVIRLRFGHGFTTAEIAEELGWSEETIRRDLQRINVETAKMGDPDHIRDQVLTALRTLLAEEYDDLHRANREDDERAKHRSKTSLRQTLELLRDVHKSVDGEATPGEAESLSIEAREALADVAETEVEGILQ